MLNKIKNLKLYLLKKLKNQFLAKLILVILLFDNSF